MHKNSWILAAGMIWTLLWGCGGGNGPPLVPTGAIQPCDEGEPSFDVWEANFNPNGRQVLLATVNTVNDDTASEFRLVVACNGKVVIDTLNGVNCAFPPPALSQGTPRCPLATVDVNTIPPPGQIQCLAEIGPTQPLGVGIGACADPAIARYEIAMKIDNAFLALALVAHNCRAQSSCLEERFGIDVGN